MEFNHVSRVKELESGNDNAIKIVSVKYLADQN